MKGRYTTRSLAVETVAFATAVLGIAGCAQSDPGGPQESANSISIMTFNVENLFDNADDPGKEDRTYLRIEDKQNAEHKDACAKVEADHWRRQCLEWDWSDEIVERKLQAIGAAIRQVNDGAGADIIALQEVENLSILERLRTEHLDGLGYQPSILIEGNDTRGIDLAFLSKLPLAGKPVLHDIEFDGEFASRQGDTRGILQADFELPDGSVLTGYAVHFPAPYHPTGMRVAAYDTLNALKRELPADRAVFAAGDFNTTTSEDARENMLDRFVRPYWIVAQDLGCGRCRGTNYYARGDSWSFLDTILWSSGESRDGQPTWQVREDSVRIANRTYEQVRGDGTPARFTLPEGRGVSDHWPLVIDIERN